jgi:hypothetical protein
MPMPDRADGKTFFPSSYSLSQSTSPKPDLSGADYPTPYAAIRWKILAIAAHPRFAGCKTCASSYDLDSQTLEIISMPGYLTWSFGEWL